MPTFWANELADQFDAWVAQCLEEAAKVEPPRVSLSKLSSYEAAHELWLTEQGGMDMVACDYGLAVDMLLVFLSRPAEMRETALPIVGDGFDEDHAWEHMSESGFRKLVYDWQLKRSQRLSTDVLS